MTMSETFLIVMAILFTVPYLVWRLGRTACYAMLQRLRVAVLCTAPAQR